MLFAVISDVHANLDALHAVLYEIKRHTPDAVWFLGDVVGYGPEPDECVEILKKNVQLLLAGNHDCAVIGLTDIEYFNPYAREAIEWTTEILTEENKAFLKTLPIFKSLRDKDYPSPTPLPDASGEGARGRVKDVISVGDICLAHSSPKEPEQWHYILNTWDVHINLQFFTERICFIGHSHYPFIAEQGPDGEIHVYKNHTDIKKGCRYMVNAGSIGQPRDGNPFAAYALLGKNFIEIKRVSYDIASTQKKMKKVGLPSFLIGRLLRGR